MKIQSVKSQVSFEKKAIFDEPVKKALHKRLNSSGAELLLDKIHASLANLTGDEVYLFNSSKISRDKRRITLFGKYKTKNSAKDVEITVNSRASQEKIQNSFDRYTNNIESQKEFVA